MIESETVSVGIYMKKKETEAVAIYQIQFLKINLTSLN